jgi:branched-subunit amino acid transport protein
VTNDLVILAFLMFAVTYPARALPLLVARVDRLPDRALAYLRLVGPAVLAALAARSIAIVGEQGGPRQFHVGIEWLAVALCFVLVAWRRNLLVGLVPAILLVAGARALGIA